MNKTAIWLGIGVVILVLVIIGASQNQNNSQQPAGAPVIAASTGEMQSACQSIADAQLRGGAYEGLAYGSGNTQTSTVSDAAYYNALNSTCVFTEHIIRYPQSWSANGATVQESNYIYSAAVMPDGVLQDVQVAGWCTTNTYVSPKESTDNNCVDFQLKQTGAGTANYKVQTLSVGNKISPTEYEALVQKYWPSAPNQ